MTCGLCLTTFDAVASLTETLPAASAEEQESEAAGEASAAAEGAPGREPAKGGASPQLDGGGAVELGDAVAGTEGEEEDGAGQAEEASEEPPSPAADGDAPDWEEVLAEIHAGPRPVPRRGSSRRRTGWIAAGVAVVGILAGVHGSYAYRTELLGVPGLRPWLETVCSLYGCRLEQSGSYDALEVAERWLEPHPRREDALTLGGALVHTGQRTLAYPELRIQLRDLNGHVTGQLWLQPADYVADSRLRAQLDEGIEPGARVPVEIDMTEPEGGAESFSLDFRRPQ